MPNPYFQFKAFTVFQDICAMKVCTDACILGAWAAEKIEPAKESAVFILDIGCGTGLLSLMLAQKETGFIDAIDINADAALQAKENVLRSGWKDNIAVTHSRLQEFIPKKKYNLIISNPPFFEADLRSPDENKNAAKHDSTLKLEELASFIKNNLHENGFSIVMIPFQRMEYFTGILKQQALFVNEILLVKQSPTHAYFRSILLFSHTQNLTVIKNELIIHDAERNYTPGFIHLLKPYYLNL